MLECWILHNVWGMGIMLECWILHIVWGMGIMLECWILHIVWGSGHYAGMLEYCTVVMASQQDIFVWPCVVFPHQLLFKLVPFVLAKRSCSGLSVSVSFRCITNHKNLSNTQ